MGEEVFVGMGYRGDSTRVCSAGYICEPCAGKQDPRISPL
jgi:hypothetical protein